MFEPRCGCFFFFQAADGIRDLYVTGVQTCALPILKGSTFVVAGHTDAAGGEAYNQDLSERRADSIKRYLTGKYSIAAADLVTVGYGKSKLKDPANPLAEMNHRVQVVNMANKNTAAK